MLQCTGNIKSPIFENAKQPRYELTDLQLKLIKSDTVNSKLWTEIIDYAQSSGSVSNLLKCPNIL